jgi:hypothetical protein
MALDHPGGDTVEHLVDRLLSLAGGMEAEEKELILEAAEWIERVGSVISTMDKAVIKSCGQILRTVAAASDLIEGEDDG